MSLLKRGARFLLWSHLLSSSVLFTSVPAHAQSRELLVGVNLTGVQRLDTKQQDALIEQLKKNDVKLVRTGIGDSYSYFIIHAYHAHRRR
jgi:hypothetical protein